MEVEKVAAFLLLTEFPVHKDFPSDFDHTSKHCTRPTSADSSFVVDNAAKLAHSRRHLLDSFVEAQLSWGDLLGHRSSLCCCRWEHLAAVADL